MQGMSHEERSSGKEKARDFGNREPCIPCSAPHPVSHLNSFCTKALFAMKLSHPTAVMHSMMNKLGSPK
jgi:hypothetical protein